MKGIVFVELLTMAEASFGEDVVDMVLDQTELASGGAYTSVGNYPCEELIKIVLAFSKHSGISPDALQKKFGGWMFDNFEKNYPEFFHNKKSSFELLEAVDGEIHVEVAKLYPDAELPHFSTRKLSENTLEMVYSSPRPLGSFCHGLIEAAVEHFEEKATITPEAVAENPNAMRFEIELINT